MLGVYLLGQNCLHLTFVQYLGSETYSRKYEILPNIVILACNNITEKNSFVENVWPATLALFIYVFCKQTHYLSQKFAIPFTMLIYLVLYLTHCKICD